MASSPSEPKQPDPAAMKLRFFRYFQHEVTALQEQMDRLGNTALAGGERNDAVEHCLAGIARLSQEVKDASSYVPAYDQKTYSDAIKALNEKLQTVRSSFAPRPKFSFKNRSANGASIGLKKNPSAISLSDAAEMAEQQDRGLKRNLGYASASDMSTGDTSRATTPPNEIATSGADREGMLHPEAATKTRALQSLDSEESQAGAQYDGRVHRPSFSQESSVSISQKSNSHIILPASAAHAVTTGSLSNLRRCIVDMSVPTASSPVSSHSSKLQPKSFAGVTLKSIKESLIVCGKVNGPAHITGLNNCIVVVSCHQFRMHQSANTDVYLACSSRPIIEDCEGLRFAPLPRPFMDDGAKESASGDNMWDQVDDFKWLKAGPNPHWTKLPEADRVADEVWTGKLPGGPDVGLDDILKAVGVGVGGEKTG